MSFPTGIPSRALAISGWSPSESLVVPLFSVTAISSHKKVVTYPPIFSSTKFGMVWHGIPLT
jgi:hypothetical protein